MFRNLFDKKNKELTKDEIAEFLKTSPEALAKFEKAYETQVLNKLPEDNLFDMNAKQAADIHSKLHNDILNKDIDELTDRIVTELLGQTVVYSYKNNKAEITKNIALPANASVTKNEIESIPSELRPQLSGNLMTKDINKNSSAILIDNYRRFLNAKNPKEKQMFYNHFRQGLDILDLDPITYEMLGQNQNSMGNWFPHLVTAHEKHDFFKLPDTTIVKVPITLLQLTRCDYSELTPTTMNIVNKFCQKVFLLNKDKEYFIKTGTYSSKFDFRNAHVYGAKEVSELGEYLLFIHFQALQMASPLSKPCIYGVSTTNEWVVREFIKDKENNPCIYKGMPLHTEYRVFVDFDSQTILGINPYWDPNVLKKRFTQSTDPTMQHDYIIYQMHEDVLMKRYNDNKDIVVKHLKEMLPDINLTGQWSIDIMQNGNDFYIIDMALAQNSALKECVPKDMLKTAKEDWIPKIS